MTENDSTIQLRKCRVCGEDKPKEQFPLTRGMRAHRCRECRAEYVQRWAEQNRDRSNQTKREWEQRNPEKAKAAKLAHARREDVKARALLRKEERRDQINARYREQYREDPTPFIERAKRRDERERSAEGVFTIEDERAMLSVQNGKCNMCAISIANGNYHTDHIVPLVKGGSHWPINRQLLCPKCNHKKGTK